MKEEPGKELMKPKFICCHIWKVLHLGHYKRVAGEWTAVDRWGKVMEMLVKMTEVLV